eukprot:1161075-Pelagomonas_calceolata.AAC.17
MARSQGGRGMTVLCLCGAADSTTVIIKAGKDDQVAWGAWYDGVVPVQGSKHYEDDQVARGTGYGVSCLCGAADSTTVIIKAGKDDQVAWGAWCDGVVPVRSSR